MGKRKDMIHPRFLANGASMTILAPASLSRPLRPYVGLGRGKWNAWASADTYPAHARGCRQVCKEYAELLSGSPAP
ncbi:unnamed protein product [Boreogadus saida]